MKHVGKDREPVAAPKADIVVDEPVECASSPCMMAQFPELTDGLVGRKLQENNPRSQK